MKKFIRGDTAVLEFAINDKEKKLVPLEDIETLFLTARQFPNEDSPILFSKSKEDFSIVDGKYNVELLPTDTEQIYIENFFFDIEVTLKDGTRQTGIYEVNMDKDYTIHGGKNEN